MSNAVMKAILSLVQITLLTVSNQKLTRENRSEKVLISLIQRVEEVDVSCKEN